MKAPTAEQLRQAAINTARHPRNTAPKVREALRNTLGHDPIQGTCYTKPEQKGDQE
ncbi:hypothetical protein TspCOW1_29830 [Thiohalobacter sp. COW1]|uniref:hypothetical protein n=1 Tax=Thiohalobacter sp. COW1 TaxID=2795687 RepID=UPI0019156FA2|nr:hypothetical protein [Thiohalobacter sp. COW1]BCO32880.1 hypothetical protein TspCOW1_29830 [Thiohalobacter sp. COW1]